MNAFHFTRTRTRTRIQITAATAFLSLCWIGGYTLAGRGDHLPASCFTSDTNRCLSEWEAGR
jgi:hypothetical protein